MLLVFNKETRKNLPAANDVQASKRSEAHTSALKAACISFGDDNPREIECIVTDISETGAKIFHVNPGELPPVFKLTFRNSAQSHQCMVAWSAKSELGVRFFFLPLA